MGQGRANEDGSRQAIYLQIADESTAAGEKVRIFEAADGVT
jgi:hypothetical protein